jgi:parallel beta helix pectate lyase-like protein
MLSSPPSERPHRETQMLRRILASVSIAFALSLFSAIGAAATVKRTFVASTGNDANQCSIAAPCRGFARAITQTSPAGEVIVLDSAGYGPVTITKSVSIIAPPGVYAGITVFSGDGITVDGAGIDVFLRGLSINGQGGYYGIVFQQGTALTVENCEIADMGGDGVSVDANFSQVTVKDSLLRGNGLAGVAAGALGGLDIRVTVSGSTFVNNFEAVGVFAFGDQITATVTRSVVTGNGTGFQVQASSGASASIVSDGNTITYASVAAFFFTMAGGTEVIYTAGNNTVGYVGTPTSGGTLTTCCAM